MRFRPYRLRRHRANDFVASLRTRAEVAEVPVVVRGGDCVDLVVTVEDGGGFSPLL